MKPLIDGDLLVYEAAFACEGKSSDDVLDVLINRVDEICEKVGATQAPTIFLTGTDNFRTKLAKTKEYKGNRSKPKPFHYRNARAMLQGRFDAQVVDGMEADDMLCITQTDGLKNGFPTIICSRDKDLMQCPGWHYRWESWNQGEMKPTFVDDLGCLELKRGKTNKLVGCGYKFFAAQVLMGDSVDNIPGAKKFGPVSAFNILNECNSKEECDEALSCVFMSLPPTNWEDKLMEQINLVWLIRELKDGKPVLWNGETYEG